MFYDILYTMSGIRGCLSIAEKCTMLTVDNYYRHNAFSFVSPHEKVEKFYKSLVL